MEERRWDSPGTAHACFMRMFCSMISMNWAEVGRFSRITEVKKQYSPYKFNKYIKLLQVVNINPVPIAKNEGITYLHNPLHIAA